MHCAALHLPILVCCWGTSGWGTSSTWEYSLPALDRSNLFKAEYLWPATQLFPSRTGPPVYSWKYYLIYSQADILYAGNPSRGVPSHLIGLKSSSTFGLITLKSWAGAWKTNTAEQFGGTSQMRLWDGKCTVKESKSKCTDQREDIRPYIKPKKSPVLMTKQKGKETTKIMSGSVEVEPDRVTNSRQFYSDFRINCEYLEGLDLHLYAGHQSNIGHFLQPKWSTWSGRWGSQFWPRFSKVIFIYSYFSKNLYLFPCFRMTSLPKLGIIFGFRAEKYLSTCVTSICMGVYVC